MRINQLSTQLANQIAAGEVIERPKSVVKELLENAIDAHAKNIEIEIQTGGIKLIKIKDDGDGIHPDDLALAINSHATSKINTSEDLFNLQSLGFRGEALASIASVSRFELISKYRTQDVAHKLSIEGKNNKINITPFGHPQGTSVYVYDLFFNTPVRRKFLKGKQTEFHHIENLVRQIALSCYNIAFKLIHDDKVILQLPAIENAKDYHVRVRKIIGKGFLSESKKINYSSDGMKLYGWVGLPTYMRSQSDQQYFYLNGRIIKDKLINHAIRSAYEGSLFEGRQSAFILYLEVLPSVVDVNVHPTKHEVRFKESRQVHDFIFSMIKREIGNDVYKMQAVSQEINLGSNKSLNLGGGNAFSVAKSNFTSKASSLSSVYRQDFADLKFNILARMKNCYLLLGYEDQHVVCNYQKVYRSLCRSKLNSGLQNNDIKSRPLLVPLSMNYSAEEILLLNDGAVQLKEFGIEFLQLDENAVSLRTFPVITPYLNFDGFMDDVLNALKSKKLNSAYMVDILINNNIMENNASNEELAIILRFLQQHMEGEGQDNLQEPGSYKVVKDSDWEKLCHAK